MESNLKPNSQPPPRKQFEPRSNPDNTQDFLNSTTNDIPVLTADSDPRTKLTVLDTIWNISNAIQGMFVLSLPWAIEHGGFFGLFLIVMTAVVCAYTGGILIDCLYEDGPPGQGKRKVYSSYQELSKVCMGPIGPIIVNVSQAVELFMICTLYVVVSGDLLHSLFPNLLSKVTFSLLAGIVLLPCSMISDLKAVSKFSCLCSIGQFLVYIVIIVYCCQTMQEAGGWAVGMSKLKFYVEWKEFSVGVGAIVFSYTSQFYLPSLEGDMADKSKFKVVF